MNWRSLICLVILFSIGVASCSPKYSGQLAGSNGELTAPPPDAGLVPAPRAFLKVYPRKSKMGVDYTGCQTLWAPDGAAWAPLQVITFERGHVVSMRIAQTPDFPLEECIWKSGLLITGDKRGCDFYKSLFPYPSLPAGCDTKEAKAEICVEDSDI